MLSRTLLEILRCPACAAACAAAPAGARGGSSAPLPEREPATPPAPGLRAGTPPGAGEEPGALGYDPERDILTCTTCRKTYTVRNGIPIMTATDERSR